MAMAEFRWLSGLAAMISAIGACTRFPGVWSATFNRQLSSNPFPSGVRCFRPKTTSRECADHGELLTWYSSSWKYMKALIERQRYWSWKADDRIPELSAKEISFPLGKRHKALLRFPRWFDARNE